MNLFNCVVVAALPLVPHPLVRRIAQRYVAGETLEQTLETVEALNAEGCMATLDVLGEDVARCEDTERAVAEYLRALDGIASRSPGSGSRAKCTNSRCFSGSPESCAASSSRPGTGSECTCRTARRGRLTRCGA
jgi:proline dehydrogenase